MVLCCPLRLCLPLAVAANQLVIVQNMFPVALVYVQPVNICAYYGNSPGKLVWV